MCGEVKFDPVLVELAVQNSGPEPTARALRFSASRSQIRSKTADSDNDSATSPPTANSTRLSSSTTAYALTLCYQHTHPRGLIPTMPPAHTPLSPPKSPPLPPSLPNELLSLVHSLTRRLDDVQNYQLPQLAGCEGPISLHNELAAGVRAELAGAKADLEVSYNLTRTRLRV